MMNNAVTITELNQYIKLILENDTMLKHVYVRGEISNFTHHSSGHMYFTLKDRNSKIKCIMFKSYNSLLKFDPEEGMNVLIRGNVSLYERDGQYQLYCSKMEPDGIGGLYLAYEQLKKRLEEEGLFLETHKKRIPEYPHKIGVATSPTGAVIQDIINVASGRHRGVDILLYPVKVQGDGASDELIKAVEYFNSREDIDVIIIGRGGGSIEELWAFNNEALARVIYDSRIPVVSAVGHETDFTIADFVSDLRASTPSHAAELCSPSDRALKFRLQTNQDRMNQSVISMIADSRHQISVFASDIDKNSPQNRLQNQFQYIDHLSGMLNYEMDASMERTKSLLILGMSKLEQLNPLRILMRGYAFVEKDSKVVSSVNMLSSKDKILLRMKDGHAECEVINIKENEIWQ